jgi:two-component system CheB/CheR fusion protein
VRFGQGGTSASLLAVTALSIWGALERRGPFALQSPADSLLELQLFLLTVAVPLLLLSALLRQQRRTAAALADSRRQYQSVVEDQSEMICRFLPDGTYTFANAAYARAAGRPATELVGGNIWRMGLAATHRSARELAEDVTPSRPMATRETEVSSPALETRWQQWRERGFFDARGAVVEYQAVGHDITDAKRAEDERRQREAQRSVESALREADRRKDEFLAMLGHELRNPLAPIGLALQILRQAAPGSSQATWAQGAIARQLSHMTRLVDDLLDISRVTLGKIQLQQEAVDLAQVIASAVETSRPLFDAQKHELTVTAGDVPLVLRGDAVRLTQVLANVLNNAAKYTEPGGRIQISARRDGDSAEISVWDNGIGIAPEALGRIFDLFAQAPAASERGQSGGLGVGLTLAKRLVEMHGGTVEARSAGLNQGSQVIVRLPLAASEVPDLSADGGRQVERRQISLRILAVDDNIDIANGLAQLLGMWGHTVRTAHDGEEAIDAAMSFCPDVVLLDLGLPKLDGLEVARRLRGAGRHASTLFVSMSGFGQEQTRVHSHEAGFDHHLIKPVDPDSLRSLLDGHARNMRPAAASRAHVPAEIHPRVVDPG